MIDIKFIIENPEKIKAGAIKKHIKCDVDKLMEVYNERKELLQKVEELRAKQNEVSKQIPNAQQEEKQKLLADMSEVKDELKLLDPKLQELENEIDALAAYMPNPPLDSVPEGKDDSLNQVLTTFGEKTIFNFTPKTHIELGKELDIIDIERATRMSGARFYYLKNDGALLEFAILQYLIQKLSSKGLAPIIPPTLVKEEALYATGFFPADKNEIYSVNPGEDDLFLIGTSEVPLTMLHATETIDLDKLPLRYFAFSTCYRREAGSYGKDTTGIIRVHQFDKIEMFSFCHSDKSEQEHEFLVSIEEEIMQDLNFHYQKINVCGGDLGAPAAKKYDIEAWIPTQEKFRELTSCSNCTDFQSRRAKIKFTNENKEKAYVHTLNGTALAMPRAIVSIIENNQNQDGSINIPEVLQPFMGGRSKIQRKSM